MSIEDFRCGSPHSRARLAVASRWLASPRRTLAAAMQRTPPAPSSAEEQYSDEDGDVGRPRRRPHRLQFYVFVVVSAGGCGSVRTCSSAPRRRRRQCRRRRRRRANGGRADRRRRHRHCQRRLCLEIRRRRRALAAAARRAPRPQLQRKRWKSLNGLWEATARGSWCRSRPSRCSPAWRPAPRAAAPSTARASACRQRGRSTAARRWRCTLARSTGGAAWPSTASAWPSTAAASRPSRPT